MGENSSQKVKNVRFIKGIIGSDPLLFDGVPQIAFVGRSNVGKSSTINALLGNGIARPSSTPGKTSEINFFEVVLGDVYPVRDRPSLDDRSEAVSKRVYFVDLPGYGFAKRSPKENEKFRKRIIWYLADSKAPKPEWVVLVLDAKAGLTDLDCDMLDILKQENHSVLVLVNKIDKLNQSEQVKTLRLIEQELEEWEFKDSKVMPFSAVKGRGVREAWQLLH